MPRSDLHWVLFSCHWKKRLPLKHSECEVWNRSVKDGLVLMCFLKDGVSTEQQHIFLIPSCCVFLLGKRWEIRPGFFMSCQYAIHALQGACSRWLSSALKDWQAGRLSRNRIYKFQSLQVSKWKTEFYHWNKISFISDLLCPPTAADSFRRPEGGSEATAQVLLLPHRVRITALPCLRWGAQE